MPFRRLIVQTSLFLALSIESATMADDVPRLQVMVSSITQTEVLIVENNSGVIGWRIVTPQSGETQGKIENVNPSFETVFNSIIKMQSDDEQRKRIKRATLFKPTFVLLLSSETRRVSWPLTDEEHRIFANSGFMKAILSDLNDRKLLRKPQLLMDLFYPDRRASFSNPDANFQYREPNPEDSPWNDQSGED